MCAQVIQFYQSPGLGASARQAVLNKARSVTASIKSVETEFCFYVDSSEKLASSDLEKLKWILSPDFDTQLQLGQSSLRAKQSAGSRCFIEIGPRLNFSTALSTNAVSICCNIGLGEKITRVEKSTLYLFQLEKALTEDEECKLLEALHDRMTEQRYAHPVSSFQLPQSTEDWYEIDVMTRGEDALRQVSNKLGLAFDDWDITYYCNMFRDKLKRNPTSVECFDLAQSNSEHSRHWFFKGKIFVDGQEIPESLIDMVASTQKTTNANNIIKFNDNSSGILGFQDLDILVPTNSTEPSIMKVKKNQTRHIIFTAETHNFPTGVAPFPGATTGTGGRIRDVQGAGRGGHVIAATAGYMFGNLHMPNYRLEWEDSAEVYPKNFASPLQICIEASNGASDYGNKFGEPVLAGFARNFGQRNKRNERIEYIKPIMFSAGLGTIDHDFIDKHDPQPGMQVVKIGGPVYRIGVGGGAASSAQVQGCEGSESLDFGAVQRGDAEMEQKLNRLIRACLEYEQLNLIESIHDQGAGGNGNVLKEISEPLGATIYTKNFTLGDPTINTMELWGAEYQESDAILIDARNKHILDKISKREKCKADYVGHITGDRMIRLIEDEQASKHPVDVSLDLVLGSMPRKLFHYNRIHPSLSKLQLPSGLSVEAALDRVLRLPAVASKRYLTTKVDRCVTGLVAQQQCVGPQHTPLADYALISLNYFSNRGSVTSIGEQPIKGLIKPQANGRLSVSEAITNMMFCVITELADVKCSGNWMWPAKLEGEGASLVDTCQAMCAIMAQLNIAIDGGKDSLSMAAKVKMPKGEEIVKSPGTLVISAYAPVPDIRVKVTPVLHIHDTTLLYVNLSGCSNFRLGGSALAQVYGQLGDDCPDIDNSQPLKRCFNIVQQLIRDKTCTAGHDVSDGGLIVTLLEMAFASDCGLELNIPSMGHDQLAVLFAEECGVVIEVNNNHLTRVMQLFKAQTIQAIVVGKAVPQQEVTIKVDGKVVVGKTSSYWRDVWEKTSFELENHQTNPECVKQERQNLCKRKTPKWKLSFDPKKIRINIDNHLSNAPRVAVLREEGINGDREMIASLHMVGFDVIDVTVTDLMQELLNLDHLRGLIFPGGFSYADVLGSARGWAASLQFNSTVKAQLERFRKRGDTFSLGVCNGCQLMALMGWVGHKQDGAQGTLLTHNASGRFECRFSSVKIPERCRAIMLKDMGGSSLGVWVAHGEGRFVFRDHQIKQNLRGNDCISLVYVDDDNNATTEYPINPNGSEDGIAGICSEDGRHLAMMPHPERATMPWQWPFVPSQMKEIQDLPASPWAKMFQNAFDWVQSN